MTTTGAQPACEERDRLLRAYSFASSDYGRAQEVLNRRTGVLPGEEYKAIRAFAEKTKQLVEEARTALERHIAEHGCREPLPTQLFSL
jgi:hypothetical protein